MSLEAEVTLDLGCKLCARIYLAVLRRDGSSCLDEVLRDTEMRPKTLERHLNRLLFLHLVEHTPNCMYRVVKELDSVKKWRQKLDVNCEGCGRVYLALLRSNGAVNIAGIAREARMKRRTVQKHLQHLLDYGLVTQGENGLYRIRKRSKNRASL